MLARNGTRQPQISKSGAGGRGHQLDHRGGQQQTDRDAELGPARHEPAPLLGAPLHRHEHRSAPLAADRDALHEPQHGQQDRRGDADGRIAGQHPDERAADAHQQQRA